MIPLPPWLTSKLFGLALTGIGGAIIGGWAVHQWDQIAYSRLEADKAKLEASFEGYKASVAAKSAQASADAQKEQERLLRASDDLQKQLAEQTRISDEKSAQLRAILKTAKPGDVRPIGPSVGAYLDRLRADQPASPD